MTTSTPTPATPPAAKKRDAFIIKDFKDSGTGRSFTAGSLASIEAGNFFNYRACGLVRTPTAADRAAAKAAAAGDDSPDA